MPIYEYQCQECQHRLEALQQVSEPPLTTCPECSGELRKLFSAPAFQFKGSGWYVTDYARKGADKGEEKGQKGEEKAKAGGEAKDAGAGKKDKGKPEAKAVGSAGS